ncbi:hypothetical protein HYPSUDRAFT_554396 [Hypholoma sublateritium FD-334 SS-4]|uniref:Uncharacterized protein n=1 Tax=Hypholoma sublateritium (strain FD-334 SS-4) TaxID=945553 RepID=A0A0D2P658_HYPSF|nr:hypothetical protein HYPSUDRAFT_554396 [Hypholoma sublateritium FD-334 SS-4]
MKAIDEVYTTFLLDYAACEDRIQKKFAHLHDLQNNLVNLAKQGQKLDEAANKVSSEIHIDGLSKTRAACIGFGKIMGQLRPPGDDNWSGEE